MPLQIPSLCPVGRSLSLPEANAVLSAAVKLEGWALHTLEPLIAATLADVAHTFLPRPGARVRVCSPKRKVLRPRFLNENHNQVHKGDRAFPQRGGIRHARLRRLRPAAGSFVLLGMHRC